MFQIRAKALRQNELMCLGGRKRQSDVRVCGPSKGEQDKARPEKWAGTRLRILLPRAGQMPERTVLTSSNLPILQAFLLDLPHVSVEERRERGTQLPNQFVP